MSTNANQSAEIQAAETPTVYTDPIGRVLVGAEHPRTVHERIGALSDKATAALLPDTSVTRGAKIKVALPRLMPTSGTALTDADIVALADAGKDAEITFEGARMLPMADGSFKEVHKVKVLEPAKNGTLSVEAVE